jgi:hypothetical protein
MSDKLREMFEAVSDEFLKFERIENPRHPAPDICAFLMLHDLAPSKGDIVTSAEHDEIYLATDCDKLAEVATPEIVRDLHRCGVRWGDYDGLCMFV